MSKPIVAYIRVSTQQQGASGLGLEGQKAAIARFCAAEGYDVTQTSPRSRPARAPTRSSAARNSSGAEAGVSL